MGLFGMNEKELNEYRQQLEATTTSLQNRETDVQRAEQNVKYAQTKLDNDTKALLRERADFITEISREREQLAKEKGVLENRRQEVLRQEAEAKANFADVQNKTFSENIEKRESALDERQKQLDALAEEITKRLESVTKKEGEIAQRELDVTEREQKANAGFADKTATLAAEAKRQHEANQKEAQQLTERENQLNTEKKDLEKTKNELRIRELKIIEAEQKREAGYNDERAKLDKELAAKRAAWLQEESEARAALQKELNKINTKAHNDMNEEIARLREQRLADITTSANSEREGIYKNAKVEVERAHGIIQEERKAWDGEKATQLSELKQQRETNTKKAGELNAREAALNGRERELQVRAQYLDSRYNELEQTIAEQVEERKESFDQKAKDDNEEIERLRNSLSEQTKLTANFEDLKRQLGDKDATEVLKELNDQAKALRQLREDLASRPSEALQTSYENLKTENEQLTGENASLEKKISQNESIVRQATQLQREKAELEADNQMLKNKAERFEAAYTQIHDELQRLRNAYERPAEVAARYKEIEMPYIAADKVKTPNPNKQADEREWLKNISKKCDNYGLHFPKRILYAFHTAVKTAEWSPITILAGVSGTGKSELPKLYSHFGGLLFEPLSVQPNWDSQESMLGFFNSIDNKFDAQPVLRLLAQSQLPAEETYEARLARWQKMANKSLDIDPEKQKELLEAYPGLKSNVCMILLDEMNLAHPELYFAEFLSKLELRRSSSPNNVPWLPVKIGAGLPPYQLPLGRNVFWVGTMNQDETTKSLSDKVLDRSIVIHFPRPSKLKSRKNLQRLDTINSTEPLHRNTFFTWVAQNTDFIPEENPYKEFIEKINNALGETGRALGHRVWQSIEYYMANYPDVCHYTKNDTHIELKNAPDEMKNAMHTAFEDQLVQKVMPKLRGIDTRGRAKTECLDKIRELLSEGIDGKPFNLLEDFDLACELGYGQFIWQSANYIKKEEEQENASSLEQLKDSSDAQNDDEPPKGWRIDMNEAKRKKAWNKMTTQQREEAISKLNQ